MTARPAENVAHSVRQRLLNEARRVGRLYNEIEQYYAMERFLYRLVAVRARPQVRPEGRPALHCMAWQPIPANQRYRPARRPEQLRREHRRSVPRRVQTGRP